MLLAHKRHNHYRPCRIVPVYAVGLPFYCRLERIDAIFDKYSNGGKAGIFGALSGK
jgi:hypothetical protein